MRLELFGAPSERSLQSSCDNEECPHVPCLFVCFYHVCVEDLRVICAHVPIARLVVLRWSGIYLFIFASKRPSFHRLMASASLRACLLPLEPVS